MKSNTWIEDVSLSVATAIDADMQRLRKSEMDRHVFACLVAGQTVKLKALRLALDVERRKERRTIDVTPRKPRRLNGKASRAQ